MINAGEAWEAVGDRWDDTAEDESHGRWVGKRRGGWSEQVGDGQEVQSMLRCMVPSDLARLFTFQSQPCVLYCTLSISCDQCMSRGVTYRAYVVDHDTQAVHFQTSIPTGCPMLQGKQVLRLARKDMSWSPTCALSICEFGYTHQSGTVVNQLLYMAPCAARERVRSY